MVRSGHRTENLPWTRRSESRERRFQPPCARSPYERRAMSSLCSTGPLGGGGDLFLRRQRKNRRSRTRGPNLSPASSHNGGDPHRLSPESITPSGHLFDLPPPHPQRHRNIVWDTRLRPARLAGRLPDVPVAELLFDLSRPFPVRRRRSRELYAPLRHVNHHRRHTQLTHPTVRHVGVMLLY